MKHLSNLPDLANSARLLKISCELENIKDDNIFGYSIKKALREGKQLKGIIQMVKDQARDNRPLLADIIGEKLLQDIERVTI